MSQRKCGSSLYTNKVCAYTYSPSLKEYEIYYNSYFSVNLLNMTLGTGCDIHECKSHYASPGFVLASVWIASLDIFFYII